MDHSTQKGFRPKDFLKTGVFHGVRAVAVLAALFEIYFALRESMLLIHPQMTWELLTDPRIYLIFEGVLRGAWLMLLLFFYRRAGNLLHRAGKQVLLVTTGVASVLLLISLGSIISWLAGFKMGPVWMVRYAMIEVTMMMLWGLSILFLMVSPSLKASWSSRKRLYIMALVGAFVFFLLKGLVWLQMISGKFNLIESVIRPVFLVLPLLILMGRLALILLFSAVPENGDKAAGR